MGKLRLQPREFRLRAGARNEVDRRFLQIVNRLPDDANLSEFIKTAVVEYCELQSKLSEADKLQQDFAELQEEFWGFLEDLKRITAKNEEIEKLDALRSDLKALSQAIHEAV